MSALESVKKRLKSPIVLSFNDIFNQTFEWFKKCFSQAGIIIMMYALLVTVVGISIRQYFFKINILDSNVKFNFSDYSPEAVALFVLCMSILYALAAPMTASVIDCFKVTREGRFTDSSQAFKFYNDSSVFQLMLSTFILSIINIGLSTALEYGGHGFIGILITAVFGIFSALQLPLLIYKKLNAIDAIVYSFRLTAKLPTVIALLMFVSFLFSLTGIIVFCIGFFFTFSMFYGIQYGIYAHIFDEEFDKTSNEW